MASKLLIRLACAALAVCALAFPAEVSSAALDGLTLYAVSVLPTLLPFFFISSVLLSTTSCKSGPIDRVTARVFGTRRGFITALSLIAGYPMCAKLIGELGKSGAVSEREAVALTAHASIPGPMFVIGTVGLGALGSARIGLALWCVQIVAGIVNGIIFRCPKSTPVQLHTLGATQGNVLQNATSAALSSALTVGLYLALSCVLIRCATLAKLPELISTLLGGLGATKSATSTAISCIVEITCGAISLAGSGSAIALPLISATIAFGGLSVMAQSISLTNGALKPRDYVLVKLSQAALAFVISLPLLAINF